MMLESLGRKKRPGRRPVSLKLGHRRLLIESLESRQLLAGTGWQNVDKPLDVDNDQFIVAMDALAIVNRLNSGLPAELAPLPQGEVPDFYYDTNDDGFCTAADLLQVIVRLNEPNLPASVTARLMNDTGPGGVPNTDRVTTDPTIVGEVAASPGSLVYFTASLNGGQELSIKELIEPDGNFTVNESLLVALNEKLLDDGSYILRLRTVSESGYPADSELSFSLVRQIAVKMITVPFQDDLTPLVKTVVTSTTPLPNGWPVFLDIDRNNDGDYDDPNELATSSAGLLNGVASIQVTTPLADPGPLVVQPIKLRTRVTNVQGIETFDELPQTVSRLTSTALADYVNKDDGFYEVQANLEEGIPGIGYRAFTVKMTSQKWRTEAEVNKPIWEHWITIYVPTSGVQSQTALLFVTGGGNTAGRPTRNNDPFEWDYLSTIAASTSSVVVRLEQVPSEPVIFADEPLRSRTEDEIIAYTYDKFLKNPNDTEWPLLVAMVKSAVKAMDAAQSVVPELPGVPDGFQLNDFVISGASKRGWTTWLTAAVDDRVKAIMPVVFDALNLDESMLHHYGVYGFFSKAIEDYNDLGVFGRILTPAGSQLGMIVDPYHYLDNGNYEIPIFSLNSAGDEFFVSDSSQYYFDDIPSTQKYLRYVPNSGHGLNEDAYFSAGAFYNAVLKNEPLPEFSWQVLDDGSIRVNTVDTPSIVKMWQITNPIARDFRDPFMDLLGLSWTSTTLTDPGGTGVYSANVPVPATGASAFLIELTYPSGLNIPGVGNIPFKFTTHISVQSNLRLYDWLENGEITDFPDLGPLPASLPTGKTLGVALAETSFSILVGDAAVSEASAVPVAAPIVAATLSASVVAAKEKEQVLTEALAAASGDPSPHIEESGLNKELSTKLVDSLFEDDSLDPADELEELLECL